MAYGCSTERYSAQRVAETVKAAIQKQIAVIIRPEKVLSAGIINTLTEAVHIYSKDRIEITLAFKDEFERALCSYGGIQA